MATQPFDPDIVASLLRGQGAGRASPNYLKTDPRFQYAQGLAQQGADTSPTNIYGGLARLVAGGLGGYLTGRSVEQDRARRGEASNYLSSILRGETPQLAADTDNPYLADLSREYLGTSLEQQARREDAAAKQARYEQERQFEREKFEADQAYKAQQIALDRERVRQSGQKGSSLGNSTEAAALDIVYDPTVDPSSSTYRKAKTYLMAQVRTVIAPSGEIIDLPKYDEANFPQRGVVPPAPGQTPPPGGTPLAPGQTPPIAGQPPALPAAPPSEGEPPTTAPPEPQRVGRGTIVGRVASQKNLQDAANAVAEAESLLDTLGEYRNAVNNATRTDRVAARLGVPTPGASTLQTATSNAILSAKGNALYELGVLNVNDLPQLQKALGDPTSVGSIVAEGGEGFNARINQIEKLIRDRTNNYLESSRSAGIALPKELRLRTRTAPTAQQPSQATQSGGPATAPAPAAAPAAPPSLPPPQQSQEERSGRVLQYRRPG